MAKNDTNWIAVDWQGLRLSFWHMQGAEKQTLLLEKPTSSRSTIATTLSEGLNDLPEPLRDCPVFTTDFSSETASHAMVPCKPLEFRGQTQIPAISQEAPLANSFGASAAILGFIDKEPEFDGILVLPGAETIWAHVSAKEVVSLRSVSTLRVFSSICAPFSEADAEGFTAQKSQFETAMTDTLSRPETLAQNLGSAQVAMLNGTDSLARCLALGGLLGAELAAMRPYWLGQQVALIAESDVAPLYQRAFDSQFIMYQNENRADLACRGLAVFREASLT